MYVCMCIIMFECSCMYTCTCVSQLHSCGNIMQVLRGHRRADSLMEDYCDGSRMHEHPLFSNDQISLQIQLYYDDLEVCNPIGSRTKIHKLGKYMCIYIFVIVLCMMSYAFNSCFLLCFGEYFPKISIYFKSHSTSVNFEAIFVATVWY